jgi:murein DD-endopeptidase MepM/ murein hydrolase activator NlpD
MSTRRDPKGDVVTFMYVPGRTGQIKRMHFARVWVRRAFAAGCVLCLALGGLFVDYARVRYQLTELDYLREQTREQAHQLDEYTDQMQQISESLKRVSSFDRKLRVITNLDPADPLPLPGIGGVEGDLVDVDQLTGLTRDRRHRRIMQGLGNLSEAAGAEAESLAALIAHLEDQTAKLRATPSIAPTKGWVTSAFGYRTSPFTANREFHRGLDIAGRLGTPVYAPADGTVRFAGHRRALGNSVSLRHGYGVSTIYGHMNELTVEAGQKVERGDQIGTLGSTGRSTGPHLHYQVQVNGSPVDPRNYILD